MKAVSIRTPILVFAYTAIVLAALFCICTLYLENDMLYMKNETMEQDILEWERKTQELNNELEKINRYTQNYGTSPEVVAAVLRESEIFDVDPAIMFELIKLESDFDANAVSSHGAIGLCQLRPLTARELSRDLGVTYSDEMLYDIDYNIMLAAFYLSKLLETNDNDYHKALTAYNRGPTGLQNYIARTGTAVSSYSSRIFKENLAFVAQ
jgi:soluble lytic murein transglycosylase-like protein